MNQSILFIIQVDQISLLISNIITPCKVALLGSKACKEATVNIRSQVEIYWKRCIDQLSLACKKLHTANTPIDKEATAFDLMEEPPLLPQH
jgi:arsenate reductase-like glutaredoxin family protein